jgi:hypothetical protein
MAWIDKNPLVILFKFFVEFLSQLLGNLFFAMFCCNFCHNHWTAKKNFGGNILKIGYITLSIQLLTSHVEITLSERNYHSARGIHDSLRRVESPIGAVWQNYLPQIERSVVFCKMIFGCFAAKFCSISKPSNMCLIENDQAMVSVTLERKCQEELAAESRYLLTTVSGFQYK